MVLETMGFSAQFIWIGWFHAGWNLAYLIWVSGQKKYMLQQKDIMNMKPRRKKIKLEFRSYTDLKIEILE